MRSAVDRAPSHFSPWAAVALAGLLVAACGGSTASPASAAPTTASAAPSDSAPPSAAPTPTPTPTAAPSKGPAAMQVGITGTSGLTGDVIASSITCGQPTLAGPQIFVLGTAGKTGPQIVMFITAAQVEIRVATGAATTLKLRSFTGTGVTNFGGLTGATIDTQLTETTAAGTATGDLGAISAIKGTIDCGDQTAGTSTITVTGNTKYGTLDGTLTAIHVTCNQTASSGNFVGVQGLSTAGGTPVLIFVTIGSTTLQVAVEIGTDGSFFSAKTVLVTKVSTTGATATGDVTEGNVASGATPKVLHVTGAATCGTFNHI